MRLRSPRPREASHRMWHCVSGSTDGSCLVPQVRVTDLSGRTLAAKKLQPEDAAHDERNATHSRNRERLSEEHDAKYRGADCADAGPDCICRSDWQLPQRQPKEPEAEDRKSTRLNSSH